MCLVKRHKRPRQGGVFLFNNYQIFTMHLKSLSRLELLNIILICFILFGALFFCFVPKSASRSAPSPRVENVTAPPKQEKNTDLPVRLKISAIDVDATIEYVGLTPDGAMDIPKKQENVAWYKLGNLPGETGNAVIAGHYGTWKNGKGSVFDNLHKLRKGDKIYVENSTGETSTFVVRESRRYEPKANASEVFISKDQKAHLNLITCEGEWNKVSKSYSQRLVVFTDKE